ncbi:MAG TPA: hypothetical protein VIL49_07270 [Capillimicrobium sp.]|jgi:hypothetical protein
MFPRTLIGAVAGALAAAALAAAPAHAADPVLAVEITGIHVIDWDLATGGYPDECDSWTKAGGTQTLGIRTPKPVRYEVLDTGMGKLLLPAGRQRFVGAARREVAEWRDHRRPMTSACTPCGPRSEYGPCDDDPQEDLLAPLWDCAPRTPDAQATLQLIPAGTETDEGVVALADVLVVATSIPATWTHCPPDFDGSDIALRADAPLEVRIVGPSVRKLASLKRGGRVTLKGSTELGWDGAAERERCDGPPGGFGYRECAITDMTVEVRRIR